MAEPMSATQEAQVREAGCSALRCGFLFYDLDEDIAPIRTDNCYRANEIMSYRH